MDMLAAQMLLHAPTTPWPVRMMGVVSTSTFVGCAAATDMPGAQTPTPAPTTKAPAWMTGVVFLRIAWEYAGAAQ